MQEVFNDLVSSTGISGINLTITLVLFSIFSLLAAFLFCIWCNNAEANKGETDPLIPPEPAEPTEEKEKDTQEKEFQRQIRANYVTLGDNLDSESGLLSRLYSKGVINIREKQMIQAQKVEHVRNEKLLDQMLKKTELDFSHFVDALRESNQDHIARILLKDGAALPVHINIETKLVNVKELELSLVRKFNDASSILLQRGHNSIDDLEDLMKSMLVEVQRKKALLTKAVPDRSIVLYFFCECPEALDNINREFKNGDLSRCVEKIVIQNILVTTTTSSRRSSKPGFINPPSINSDPSLPVSHPWRAASSPRPVATVRFRVDDEDYKRCHENFSRGDRIAQSITLIIYIKRSFRHWRSFKRQHDDVENARPYDIVY